MTWACGSTESAERGNFHAIEIQEPHAVSKGCGNRGGGHWAGEGADDLQWTFFHRGMTLLLRMWSVA